MAGVRLERMQIGDIWLRSNPQFSHVEWYEQFGGEGEFPEGWFYDVSFEYSVERRDLRTFDVAAELRAQPPAWDEDPDPTLNPGSCTWLEAGLTITGTFRVSGRTQGHTGTAHAVADAAILLADIARIRLAELTAMPGRDPLWLAQIKLDPDKIAAEIAANLSLEDESQEAVAEKSTPKKRATKAKAATKKGSKTPRKTS